MELAQFREPCGAYLGAAFANHFASTGLSFSVKMTFRVSRPLSENGNRPAEKSLASLQLEKSIRAQRARGLTFLRKTAERKIRLDYFTHVLRSFVLARD